MRDRTGGCKAATSIMDWSPQQLAALDGVRSWLDDPERQVFALFGFAGTGKTTLAREFVADLPGITLFGAYTGKAAEVMRRKGCAGAMTVHRMIYRPKPKSGKKLRALLDDLEMLRENPATEPDVLAEVERRVEEERKALKAPSFELEVAAPLSGADRAVLDEVSMIDDRMGSDLLTFGKKLLVLGDPAQLPPVGGGGFFMRRPPDFMLTEIHRQAAGSPVIALSFDAREGRRLRVGDYGNGTKVLAAGSLRGRLEEAAQFDQIIVGRNATRHRINARIRREVLGRASDLPEPGDRLVCRRNDRDTGLLNGSQWVVNESTVCDDRIALAISSAEDETISLEVVAHRSPFDEPTREIDFHEKLEAQEFNFAYAITCHTAQGSQWDDVLVIDEGHCFGRDYPRWMYTAVTRAAESVTVVQT